MDRERGVDLSLVTSDMIDAKMKDASSVGEAPKTCTLHLSSLSALSAFRAAILVTLTFSTSTTVLLMRYSKIEAERQGETGYLSSSVVFVTECVKVVVCMAALLLSQGKVLISLLFVYTSKGRVTMTRLFF